MMIVDNNLSGLRSEDENESSSENIEANDMADSNEFYPEVSFRIKKFIRYTIYYLCGTPMWYFVAKFGSTRRAAHEYRVATATPTTRKRTAQGRISSPSKLSCLWLYQVLVHILFTMIFVVIFSA